MKAVGARLPRYDGVAHVTGRTQFVDDVRVGKTLVVKALRSPHHHAAITSLDTSKAEAVKGQQAKVAESKAQGHGKRLEQRTRVLGVLEKACKDAQHTYDTRAGQAAALGPPRERADRDFRKQTIMTVRTLLLENALMSFMAVLLGLFNRKVSLECLLKILFERSGSRVETDSQVIYWVNTAGLSVSYHRLLAETVEGLCAMDLRYQGKPMQVRLKATPP